MRQDCGALGGIADRLRHVSTREGATGQAQFRVAADVIRVCVRIDDVANWFWRRFNLAVGDRGTCFGSESLRTLAEIELVLQPSDRGKDRVRHRRDARIHQQNAVATDRQGDVRPGTLQYVDIAAYRKYLDGGRI